VKEGCAPALAIVVKGYPRLSETFIARELVALERRGVCFSLHSLRRPTEDATMTDYGLVTPCQYLPEYLHEAAFQVLSGVMRASGLPGFKRGFEAFRRDFRRDPSRARLRRFGQACILAVNLGCCTRHIHCHFAHSPASVARYAALLLGVSYSISAHAKDVWTDPAWDLETKLRGARFVLTCNAAAYERLCALAPGVDIKLVHHGVAAELVVAQPPLSMRDGRDAGEPVRLVSVARAVEKKGLRHLIDALACITSRVHVRLDHYGGGPLLCSLKAHAAAHGLQHLVTFHGARPHHEVIAAMDRSDLLVFPADISADGDRDGLPNAILEANARGLCVLACDAGGVRDAIRDGETGGLVCSGDVEALASRIMSLAREPSARRQLATRALRLNAALFDAETGYDTLCALLREAGAH
jgi:glycosyltransferase involved in cell wall biosynthesis